MSAPPRILFASYHGYFDPTSGAAVATRDLLELLTKNGWSCGVCCGPDLDHALLTDRATSLARLGLSVMTGAGTEGCDHRLFHTMAAGVRCTVFEPVGWTRDRKETDAETDGFLHVFREVAARFQPDIVLTYGGQRTGLRLIALAKQMNFKVVFALHSFGYSGPATFQDVDAVFVPSAFAQAEYARRGVTAAVLPCPVSWERVKADVVEAKHITFVNPTPLKGVFVMARIMAELGRRRPDISFLVVEGRAGIDWLGRTGVDLSGVSSVRRMANTDNPRAFYRVTHTLVVPAVSWETLGRVAIEAMINGIPVVASDRPALPETIGNAGVCLPIPAEITPESRVAPDAVGVKPWCDEIERLWDDRAYFEERQRQSLAGAERWRPAALVAAAGEFFQKVVNNR